MGRGRVLEYSISLDYTPLIIQSHVTHEVDNTFMRTSVAFNQKNVACHVLQEISSACVDVKLKGIQVTMVLSVVTRDDPRKLTP